MMTDRLRRAFRLLVLLRQSDGLRLRDIARWLDCSQRTVYRDLQSLKESGFEVVWSSSGYRIEGDEELPRAALEAEELLALLTTIKASPLARSGPTRTQVQRAMQKLIAACSSKTRAQWLQVSGRLNAETRRSSASQQLLATIDQLSGALEQQIPLPLDMPNGNSPFDGQTQFIPERIVATPGGWTVQGREEKTNRPITLDVERIRVHQRSDSPRPPGHVPHPHFQPSSTPPSD